MPGSSMPGGGSQGGQSGSGSGASGGQTASSGGGSSSSASGGDPGFGDAAGGDLSLPSLVDEVPTYSSASASNSQEAGGSNGASGSSGGSSSGTQSDGESSQGSGPEGGQSGSGSPGGSPSGGTVVASVADGTGTRAQGGLEPDWGSDPMTTAERVAVLDRQLEASTGVFDAIIREEQRQQRSSRREQSSQSQSSGGSGTESASGGRNPYEASDEGGYGSVGGGIGGRSGGAPENPAVFEAPDDIPSGNDDDIVARQLREAAMREADPEVREALWNEYRKYKGIEIPEE
ncbi:MAG: hypothetical protein VW104_09215 [Halieaceae bacterium]